MTQNIDRLQRALHERAAEKLKAEIKDSFGKFAYAGWRPAKFKMKSKACGEVQILELDTHDTIEALKEAAFNENIDHYYQKEVEALLEAADNVIELQGRVVSLEQEQQNRT